MIFRERIFLDLHGRMSDFLFAWNYIPGFPKSHFPKSTPGRSVAGVSVELKSKASVQSFCFMLELGPV